MPAEINDGDNEVIVQEMRSEQLDKTMDTKIEIPEHRRHWESPDCIWSKTVLVEGDWSVARPRMGAAGEISLTVKSVQGLEDRELRGDLAISRYFHSPEKEAKCEVRLGTAETGVDRSLEKCLGSFLVGEKSRIILRVFLEPGYNCKAGVSMEPMWVTLEVVVCLMTLTNAEPIYKWYPETKLERARELYSLGVKLFKQSRFLDSYYLFQAAHRLAVLAVGVLTPHKPVMDNKDLKKTVADPTLVRCGGPLEEADPETREDAAGLSKNCVNNIAACHFQWNNHSSVVELSTIVLKDQPKQVKALYRRGLAYSGCGQLDLAEKDLVMAHKEDPSNRAVNEKLGQVKLRRKKEAAEMASRMSKMFT